MIKEIKNKFETGFTLIELLVVISVLSLMSSIIFVSMNDAREKAMYARTVGDLHNIARAMALYQTTYGDYPPDVWTNIPPGINEYLTVWPLGIYAGSYYDWDYWTDPQSWVTPSPPGTKVVQVSLRFCSDVASTDCQFPDQPWAAGFTNRSSIYYCLEGPCRSHKNLPVGAPGKCVNCGD